MIKPDSKTAKRGSLILKGLAVFMLIFLLKVGSASAYPTLQLYIPEATYDAVTETWTVTEANFQLWIIGNVAQHGTIYEVKLAAVFFGTGGTIDFTPTTTGLLTDPSTPDRDPNDPITVEGINYPQSGSGSNDPLPDHGIYNDPTMNSWTNYYLGDFDKTDSEIGDFMTSYPSSYDSWGQINVYDVAVTGWDRVHFDAFDHTVMTVGKDGTEKIKTWVAPFSHDASHVVPEPTTILLLGGGLVGLGLWRMKQRKSN